MKTFALGLLVALSLCANLILWRRVTGLQAAADDYPLGENMGNLQRYAEKLWYAGEAGNWDLAGYYVAELKETADDIEGANVVKDGVEVSKAMQTVLPLSVQKVDEAVAAHDAARFRECYRTMVTTCTACHQTAKHAFIRIVVPAGPPTHWNQDFAPHS